MKVHEITESKTELSALIKQAGYRPNTEHHQPVQDKHEEKVRKLEGLIKDAGFTRKKAGRSEYEYKYKVGNETITFNYRFGEKGLHAWWRE